MDNKSVADLTESTSEQSVTPEPATLRPSGWKSHTAAASPFDFKEICREATLMDLMKDISEANLERSATHQHRWELFQQQCCLWVTRAMWSAGFCFFFSHLLDSTFIMKLLFSAARPTFPTSWFCWLRTTCLCSNGEKTGLLLCCFV